MTRKVKKSILSDIPAWGLSIIASILTFILLFAVAGIFGSMEIFKNENSESIAYIFYEIIVAVCCFYICRSHPNSFWHTPLICNFPCFIAALVEPNFWTTELGPLLGAGLALSIIMSIIGRNSGLRKNETKTIDK